MHAWCFILNACYVFMCARLISSTGHGLGPQVHTICFDWLSLYACLIPSWFVLFISST